MTDLTKEEERMYLRVCRMAGNVFSGSDPVLPHAERVQKAVAAAFQIDTLVRERIIAERLATAHSPPERSWERQEGGWHTKEGVGGVVLEKDGKWWFYPAQHLEPRHGPFTSCGAAKDFADTHRRDT